MTMNYSEGRPIPLPFSQGGTNSTIQNFAPVFNVKGYGAVGDGSTDDTTAIANAISACNSAGGGIVYFPTGTYITQLISTLNNGIWLIGSGYLSSVIKLKNSSNTDLIQTTNFSTLTGTNSTSGAYNFGIANITLDGNKANNASGGNCLSIYGYGYTLCNFRIKNANAWGLWTEWGTSSASPGNDSMEAYVLDFKIHDCNTGGVYFKGPHDSQWSNGIIYTNGNNTSGAKNLYIVADQYGSGSVFSLIHLWGGTYDYAIYNNCTGITFADCQVEGSKIAEIYNAANSCNFNDVKIFSLESNTVSNAVKGIFFANSSMTCMGTLKMENIGGAIFDLTSSGGGHNFDVFADYYTVGVNAPSPAIIGTVDGTSRISLHMTNGSPNTNSSYLPQTIYNDGLHIKPVSANTSSQLVVESSGTGNEASIQMIGHNASNDSDYAIMSMRTENPDFVVSVYDSSATTFHQFFTYTYLSNRISLASNTLTDSFGSYNTPANNVVANFVSQDDSNNASPSSVDVQMRFNSGAYTEAAGKMAKISAIRPNADFAATVDLAFYTSPTNSTTLERVRITNDGKVGIGTSSPGQTLDVNGSINVANKINITTGSNKSAGIGTLSGGTVIISTTAVTSSSLIFLTDTTNSLTNLGTLTVSSISAGTSFTVKSSNVLDTSTFNWLIIN